MEYLIIVLVCAVAAGFLIFRRKKKKASQDTYVCDVCGETECLCHKVEKK
jgi:LPXTG-motif cell wall-anchored protein